jgi:flagellar biosynthesis/type III secretory pathway chaperone
MFSVKKTVTQASIMKKLSKASVYLIDAIKDENKILESGNLSLLEVACEKKVKYLQEFSDSQEDLSNFMDYSKIDQSDPILLELKKVFLEIDKVNKRNEILLRANIEATNRIIEFYKEAQKNKVTKNYGYNSQGNIIVSKDLEKVMPSISLNNKI